jgi:hypothetical protein
MDLAGSSSEDIQPLALDKSYHPRLRAPSARAQGGLTVKRTPLVLLAIGLASCGGSGGETAPPGNWAQALPPGDLDVAELTVDATGAATGQFGVDTVTNPNQSINYCAMVTLPRLILDSSGNFDVNGTLAGRGTGLTDGPAVPSARFTGSVRGGTMELTVTTANGTWGRFTLTLGAPFQGERVCID